jgi:hypothetical protein
MASACAERRFGNFLHTKDRSECVLSSKVEKLFMVSRQNHAKEYFPFTPSPNNLVFPRAANGIARIHCEPGELHLSHRWPHWRGQVREDFS